MYSNSDFERFFIRYKAESAISRESIQNFCFRNNLPYNLFEKWYKDRRSYSLYERRFVPNYKFMHVEFENDLSVYKINWEDVVLLLESPVIKRLNIR